MHSPDRPLTRAEQRIVERLRKVTSALPGVIIVRDGFGHTTFRVGRRSFIIVGPGEDDLGHIAIKADLLTQDALMRRGPWFRTPYIGQHGWVSVTGNAKFDWREVEELVRDAWRSVAPKRLADQLD